MADFKRELNEEIYAFHQHVLSAKPDSSEQDRDPAAYAARMIAYQDFLRLAGNIIRRLQVSFSAVLGSYRRYIDQTWQYIQQNRDVLPLQQEFNERIRDQLDRQWSSVFIKAEKLIREINMNLVNMKYV